MDLVVGVPRSEMLPALLIGLALKLCHDPLAHENDDGDAYLQFLQTAKPLFTPTQRIETLVTSRLEKYRPQTEQWLRDRGVQYDKLVMLDVPDAATRRKLGVHGAFKSEYY